ncbi:MAG: hypothetical protein JWO56_1604, partial [Acidobacteria bacterium]|nr:hypothetical protein [Acidobacteriota bacterium]
MRNAVRRLLPVAFLCMLVAATAQAQ